MLEKVIKYTDFKGNKREETFTFNLTPAEVMELELGTTGGLAEAIQSIIEAQDAPSIIKTFKEIILKSYGKISADGREFMKSEEISKSFSQTNAYSKLFMELSTDDKAAAAFINGIVPEDMQLSDEAIAEAQATVN